MQSHFAQSRLIWSPKEPNRRRIEAFRRYVNHKHRLNLSRPPLVSCITRFEQFETGNFAELHDYSVTVDEFWKDLWDYAEVVSSRSPDKVLTEGPMKECPIWFPGALFNVAENLLRFDSDKVAVTCARENGQVEHYTYKQLRGMIREMAAAMRAYGLQAGDRVAAVITNHVHAIVIALAAISIGAVYSSTATDMGPAGILDRYRQIEARLLFLETGVTYAGRPIDLMPMVQEVVPDLMEYGLERAILLPDTRTQQERLPSDMPSCMSLSQFLSRDDGRPLTFHQVPFSYPVYILYSSGTTGPPKCIVHGGGAFLNPLKGIMFGNDASKDDVHFSYTSSGWMVWNAMLPCLANGTRLITYDGSPFHPDVRTFLKFISDQGVSIWITSPRFLAEVQGAGIDPLKVASFEALHTVCSVGAVLTAPMFEWTQKVFGSKVYVSSATGGTDVCGGLIQSVPAMPSYAGELQGKSLGMAVGIFDDSGKDIEDTGEPGEMVVTRPHISLPLGFWGDANNEKYRKTYFSTYPGVWYQGDIAVKNPVTKGFMVLGRSDGVLNPSGIRFGSAEIYSVLEAFRDEIDDSLCVGQRRPQDKDERVLLFLKMRPGKPMDNDLLHRIRTAIRKARSARHIPAYIFQVDEIPYTVNGKKVEIAVKQIVSGSTLKPSGTVANPESLELYYKYRELEKLHAEGDGSSRPRARL